LPDPHRVVGRGAPIPVEARLDDRVPTA